MVKTNSPNLTWAQSRISCLKFIRTTATLLKCCRAWNRVIWLNQSPPTEPSSKFSSTLIWTIIMGSAKNSSRWLFLIWAELINPSTKTECTKTTIVSSCYRAGDLSSSLTNWTSGWKRTSYFLLNTLTRC